MKQQNPLVPVSCGPVVFKKWKDGGRLLHIPCISRPIFYTIQFWGHSCHTMSCPCQVELQWYVLGREDVVRESSRNVVIVSHKSTCYEQGFSSGFQPLKVALLPCSSSRIVCLRSERFLGIDRRKKCNVLSVKSRRHSEAHVNDACCSNFPAQNVGLPHVSLPTCSSG